MYFRSLKGKNMSKKTAVEISEPKLIMDEKGLMLSDGVNSMCGDFTAMLPRLKHNNLSHEMIVKAAKIKGDTNLHVIDATAGMGEDSLLLAAAGFRVDLYEKDPVIAALLKDTIKRAAENEELKNIVSNMTLHEEDSVAAMNNYSGGVDVIILDPMFPERQKSGLIKKKFQLIHQLEKPCDNEEELLNAAFAANPRKIVIKRPLKGPYLADRKPDYSLEGKAIRYDCIIVNVGENNE